MKSSWHGIMKIFSRTNLEISSFHQLKSARSVKIEIGESSIFFCLEFSMKMLRFSRIWMGMPQSSDLEPTLLLADPWKSSCISPAGSSFVTVFRIPNPISCAKTCPRSILHNIPSILAQWQSLFQLKTVLVKYWWLQVFSDSRLRGVEQNRHRWTP